MSLRQVTTQAKTDKPAKKEKAKKDPNAPKRGLSAFMYFSNEERPKVNLLDTHTQNAAHLKRKYTKHLQV